MCVSVCLLVYCVHALYIELRRGYEALAVRVTGTESGPLREQLMLQGTEPSFQSQRRVAGGCELPMWMLDGKLVQEQQVLLTAEPSPVLHLQFLSIYYYWVICVYGRIPRHEDSIWGWLSPSTSLRKDFSILPIEPYWLSGLLTFWLRKSSDFFEV